MNRHEVIVSSTLLGLAALFSLGFVWYQSQQSKQAANTPSPTPKVTVAPTASASAVATPQQAQPVTQTVKLYLVAIDDNGKTGPKIGCGDSLVPVNRTLTTETPLKDAVSALIGMKDRYFGESGLYNSLYQSNLQLASASIVNGEARVALTGNLVLSGECDNPRVEEQLTETIKQFPSVNSVKVTINGKSLQEAVSLK